MEDIQLVEKVVLSTASKERVRTLELLIAHGGSLTTSEITKSLNVSKPTAKRTMAEFKALSLVDIDEPDQPNSEHRMILNDDFDWFLTEEFSMLKDGTFPLEN